MSRNKTLSSLAIAAFVVLGAATQSFAQAQSSFSRAESNRNVAAPASGPALAFNRPSFAIVPFSGISTSKNVAGTPNGAGSPVLSAATFKSTDHFSFVKNQLRFESPSTVYEVVPSFSSKQQFRSDDEGRVERSNHRITFVPSRGQKIPS
jgi:hypothetical protein